MVVWYCWYFEEGGVVLLSGWWGALKRVVWYFEQGGVVLSILRCGTLKTMVCYFEDGGVLWLWMIIFIIRPGSVGCIDRSGHHTRFGDGFRHLVCSALLVCDQCVDPFHLHPFARYFLLIWHIYISHFVLRCLYAASMGSISSTPLHTVFFNPTCFNFKLRRALLLQFHGKKIKKCTRVFPKGPKEIIWHHVGNYSFAVF